MNKIKVKIFYFFIKVTNSIFIKIRNFIYLKSIKLFLKKKNSKNINFLSLLIVIIVLFHYHFFYSEISRRKQNYWLYYRIIFTIYY
jgi:hypothetical protein